MSRRLRELISEAATVPPPADLDDPAAVEEWQGVAAIRLEAIRAATSSPTDPLTCAALRDRIDASPITYPTEATP